MVGGAARQQQLQETPHRPLLTLTPFLAKLYACADFYQKGLKLAKIFAPAAGKA